MQTVSRRSLAMKVVLGFCLLTVLFVSFASRAEAQALAFNGVFGYPPPMMAPVPYPAYPAYAPYGMGYGYGVAAPYYLSRRHIYGFSGYGYGGAGYGIGGYGGWGYGGMGYGGMGYGGVGYGGLGYGYGPMNPYYALSYSSRLYQQQALQTQGIYMLQQQAIATQLQQSQARLDQLNGLKMQLQNYYLTLSPDDKARLRTAMQEKYRGLPANEQAAWQADPLVQQILLAQ